MSPWSGVVRNFSEPKLFGEGPTVSARMGHYLLTLLKLII
jgi:hypothetical protein